MYTCGWVMTGANTTMIVVETVDGDVFGGFASEQWHVDTVCYGGGESFVFKIGGKKNSSDVMVLCLTIFFFVCQLIAKE